MNRILIATLLLAPSAALAGKPKTVTVASAGQYDKAQFQQAVVTSEGRVTLARQLRPLALKAPLDAARVWDVVEDKAGNLFVATGDDGKIFKIAPDGAVTLAYDADDSQVFCLLAAADGAIYAGTGPSGLIVRIDAAGVAKVWHDSPESYVWALAADEKTGAIFAATGPHGRVFTIADGKADVFFQCKQDHVLCLARAADGTLYAGTDKQGVVYRIDAKGKGFVLFQAAQAEVRCLQLVGDTLHAGTSSPAGGRSFTGLSGSNAPASPAVGAIPRETPERASGGDKTKAAGNSPATRERDGEKFPASPAAGAAGGGDNSVYRVGPDGAARELFREKGLVLGLLKSGDRLYVGTGAKGQLVEIDERTKERSEVARLDVGQVQKLLRRRDGSILLACGDPGKLFTLQDRFAAAGSVVSEVIDAKLVARWGAVGWQAETPAGTKLTLAVRGGNVAEPDETWTDWSAEMVDPKTAAAALPPARFAQFRASLATTDPAVAPSLQHVAIRFATVNQAPEVGAIETPSLDAVAASKEPKKYKLKWTATDANEDELTFDVHVRKDGWKDWVRVEEALGKAEAEWDVTTMPSGVYRVRVTASDAADNAEGAALAGERISGPVTVAHEPPAVSVKFVGMAKDKAVFEATASAGLVRLAAAGFAVSGGKWAALQPADNLFDARQETFRFTAEAPPGPHVLVVRVRDAAGNAGAADVLFTVPPRGQ